MTATKTETAGSGLVNACVCFTLRLHDLDCDNMCVDVGHLPRLDSAQEQTEELAKQQTRQHNMHVGPGDTYKVKGFVCSIQTRFHTIKRETTHRDT